MITNEQKLAMSDAAERLKVFARALEIEEEIKDSIYNFQSYNPLDDFYSRKNIFKFPKYLVNASLRCRDLFSKLGVSDIEHLRYLKQMHFIALGYLNKNIKKLGFKKALEHVPWMQPFGPSECSQLRYLMEYEAKEAVFGENNVSWIEIFAIDSCLTIEEAYCTTIFLRKASKYPELKEKRLEIARKYKGDYLFAAFEALESISFAEGLYAAETAKKTAVRSNTKKAANRAHEQIKRFRVKCISLFEDKYSSLSNRKAARLIFQQLANDVDSPYRELNPEGKDYSETLSRWIAVWKKYKSSGGELYNFCSNSLGDAKEFISQKNKN